MKFLGPWGIIAITCIPPALLVWALTFLSKATSLVDLRP